MASYRQVKNASNGAVLRPTPILVASYRQVKEELTMAENKMEQVAAMFGKKLNEEFKIITPQGRIRTVKFTAEYGLMYYDRIEREWNKNFVYLNFLCEGKAVIVDD